MAIAKYIIINENYHKAQFTSNIKIKYFLQKKKN